MRKIKSFLRDWLEISEDKFHLDAELIKMRNKIDSLESQLGDAEYHIEDLKRTAGDLEYTVEDKVSTWDIEEYVEDARVKTLTALVASYVAVAFSELVHFL